MLASSLLWVLGSTPSHAQVGPAGAWPSPGGVTFRVWAPHATSVSVMGDFDGWNPAAHPLAAEPGGWWAADVRGAAVGDAYRYQLHNGAQLLERRDPRARAVTSSSFASGDSVVYDPSAFAWGADAPVWPALDDLVIYQLHVGTFAPPGGAVPGTLDDAIAGLDHVASLGVTAVELLPVSEFPGTVGLGYDPSDPYAVEQQAYGGPDALKRFVAAAHARGLAVIADVVVNHVGPRDSHLHRFDGWSTAAFDGGIYFWDTARGQTPWGPRPNYAAPEVRDWLLDLARMWVEEYRVDGLRWDATSYVTHTDGLGSPFLPEGASLLVAANEAIDRLVPGVASIAEDLRGADRITLDTASGGVGFDSQWDGLGWDVRRELAVRVDANRDMIALAAALERVPNGDGLQRTVFTETHDLASAAGGGRVPTAVVPTDPEGWTSRRRSGLAAAFVLTAPGVPLLLQGQELLETEAFDPAVPMDWSRVASQGGTLALWRDLVGLRRDLGGVSGGLRGSSIDVHHVDDTAKILAWHRWDAGGGADDVVVVANLSATSASAVRVGFPQAGTWRVRLNSDRRVYGADYGDWGSVSVVAGGPPADGKPASGLVDVAGYSVLVLSR